MGVPAIPSTTELERPGCVATMLLPPPNSSSCLFRECMFARRGLMHLPSLLQEEIREIRVPRWTDRREFVGECRPTDTRQQALQVGRPPFLL